MKINKGMRLVKNAVLTIDVMVVGVFWSLDDRRGIMIGRRRIVSVRSMEVLRSSVVSIAFTWSCTKMGGS